jgi:hypothetical protein
MQKSPAMPAVVLLPRTTGRVELHLADDLTSVGLVDGESGSAATRPGSATMEKPRQPAAVSSGYSHRHMRRRRDGGRQVELLDADDETAFNAAIEAGSQEMSPAMQQEFAWRAKPYGDQPSAYATFKTAEKYSLGDLVKQINTPIMITDPEGEQFWPGQSQKLYHALSGPKVLVSFTNAEGAGLHCQPMGRSLLEQRMYDWLDETLAH